MSDFLTSLVSRASGASPAIKPRLPGLFEPPRRDFSSLSETAETVLQRGAVHNEAKQEPNLDTAEPSHSLAQSVKRKISNRVQPRPDLSQSISGEAEVQDQTEVRLIEPQSADLPLSTKEPTRSRPTPTLEPRSPLSSLIAPEKAESMALLELAPRIKASHPSFPAALHQGSGQPFNRSLTPPPDHAIPLAQGQTRQTMPDNPTPAIANSSHQPLITAQPPLEWQAGEPIAAQTQNVTPTAFELSSAQPRSQRLEFARHLPPLASRSQEPEPTIQVTIGRIEVRAVSAQSPKPKERSSSPVMSLNDYLQQRSRRGGA